jgi:hypothetical protein
MHGTRRPGYHVTVAREKNGSRGLVEGAVEKPKDLAREAERGRSERTPFIALTGVTVVVGIAVAVVLAVALLVYFLA